jgi:hypothetical protein
MPFDETQATEASEYPQSCPPIDPIGLYATFEVTYQIWSERQYEGYNQLAGPNHRPYHHKPLSPEVPIPSLHLCLTDMSFKTFKRRIYDHLAPICQDNAAKLIKAADHENKIAWRCLILNHPTYGADQDFLATDENSFRAFAVAAALWEGQGKRLVEIVMEEPESSNGLPSSQGSIVCSVIDIPINCLFADSCDFLSVSLCLHHRKLARISDHPLL